MHKKTTTSLQGQGDKQTMREKMRLQLSGHNMGFSWRTANRSTPISQYDQGENFFVKSIYVDEERKLIEMAESASPFFTPSLRCLLDDSVDPIKKQDPVNVEYFSILLASTHAKIISVDIRCLCRLIILFPRTCVELVLDFRGSFGQNLKIRIFSDMPRCS